MNRGDLLILLAAVTRALHLIASKKFGSDGKDSAGVLTAIQFGVVAVLAFTAALSSGRFLADLAHTDMKTWSLILYMVVVCTVFAFFIQLWAVRDRSASHVGLLLGTEPVFAAGVGVTLGHGTLSPQGWLGVALIVGATYWGRGSICGHGSMSVPEPLGG